MNPASSRTYVFIMCTFSISWVLGYIGFHWVQVSSGLSCLVIASINRALLPTISRLVYFTL